MQSRQPRRANPIPHIIAAISAARSCCIQVYPKIRNSISWFLGLFTHEVAKYLYKQVARAIYAAWVVFTFFIGYQIFLAGAIQPQPSSDNGTTTVTMTRGLATKLVTAFGIILVLGLALSVIKTVEYFRELAKGKREVTLRSLSERIDSIETRLGRLEKQEEERQKHANNTKKKAKQQKPKQKGEGS